MRRGGVRTVIRAITNIYTCAYMWSKSYTSVCACTSMKSYVRARHHGSNSAKSAKSAKSANLVETDVRRPRAVVFRRDFNLLGLPGKKPEN